MKQQLLYVELKQGHSGPAWIGYGQFSKTGRTVYFDGKILKAGQGISGNHFDIESNEEYWVSGVKKNGTDRHKFGSGKILIDRSVTDDYLKIIGKTALPKNKFILADLNNTANKKLSEEIENEKFSGQSFDSRLLYKKTPKDLRDDELNDVIDYYTGTDLQSIHLKGRKEFLNKMNTYTTERQTRATATE